jgi:hypothetical protein
MRTMDRIFLCAGHVVLNFILPLMVGGSTSSLLDRFGRHPTFESGEVLLVVSVLAVVATVVVWSLPLKRRIVPSLALTFATIIGTVAASWFWGSYPASGGGAVAG